MASHGTRWPVSWWKCLSAVCVLTSLASMLCSGEHGTYLCKDSVTNATIVTGIFPDYDFAPFESPANPDNWGMNYYNNIQCTFDLVAPSGLHVYIEFTSLTLDSACSGDYITLQLDSSSTRTICGQPSGFIYDIYESNVAHVEFKTDEAVTNTGFTAFFSAYDPLATKRSPGPEPLGINLREPEPSGLEPLSPGSRSNAWLLNKRTSTQYLHHYRYNNRHEARSALPLHDTKAMRKLLQTREAIDFQTDSVKQKERLEMALRIRKSYDRESLRFMRYAASGTDIGRYCGNTCQRTKADLIRFCRESRGLV